jgi:hypothetical protein
VFFSGLRLVSLSLAGRTTGFALRRSIRRVAARGCKAMRGPAQAEPPAGQGQDKNRFATSAAPKFTRFLALT